MAHSNGYITKYVPFHPKASSSGMVNAHILIAEKAIGKYLPTKAVVHHIDENGYNNKNTNLVICENQAYHKLLHIRMRILKYGGSPDIDKICSGCQVVKSKSEFNSNSSTVDGLGFECRNCANFRRKQYPQYK